MERLDLLFFKERRKYFPNTQVSDVPYGENPQSGWLSCSHFTDVGAETQWPGRLTHWRALKPSPGQKPSLVLPTAPASSKVVLVLDLSLPRQWGPLPPGPDPGGSACEDQALSKRQTDDRVGSRGRE